MTLDPATSLPTGGVHEHGVSPGRAQRLLELEFADGDVIKLGDLARARESVATLSAATRGELQHSARYREVLAPEGLAHEVGAVFRDAYGPWAALVLMRGDDTRDFDQQDIALLNAVGERVTRALRRTLLLAEIDGRDGNEAPALLLHGEGSMVVRHASPSAVYWLAQIDDGTTAQLPFALYSLAQRARAAGHALARLRTRGGRWLTAHAEGIGGSDGEASLILQPSRPHEIAQVLAGAYGLTPREREVARLVAAGRSNTEIASLLFLSRYTVEDHLRHLFDKLAVNSRSALVSRLFFDQYAPNAQVASGLDGQGWFMTRGDPS
jgi:DNA-binding CsgD family transcriptional regulator